MREEGRRINGQDNQFRTLMFWAGGVLLVAVILFTITYALYSNRVKNQARVSELTTQKIGELVPSISVQDNSSTSASSSIGKSVEEVKEEIEQTEEEPEEAIANEIQSEEIKESDIKTNKKEDKIEEKKELSFKMPVEGEIAKEYAKDNLIYSETLKEWITHLGIDIKAEKTTVVKAAEAGTVKSIKNDPRYGLTVIIEHDDGFQSVYSNLLTAEFVSEGEKIEQGQTVGTVGTTAIFEVAEDAHLHFEIWKDGEQVDPKIYLKFN